MYLHVIAACKTIGKGIFSASMSEIKSPAGVVAENTRAAMTHKSAFESMVRENKRPALALSSKNIPPKVRHNRKGRANAARLMSSLRESPQYSVAEMGNAKNGMSLQNSYFPKERTAIMKIKVAAAFDKGDKRSGPEYSGNSLAFAALGIRTPDCLNGFIPALPSGEKDSRSREQDKS